MKKSQSMYDTFIKFEEHGQVATHMIRVFTHDDTCVRCKCYTSRKDAHHNAQLQSLREGVSYVRVYTINARYANCKSSCYFNIGHVYVKGQKRDVLHRAYNETQTTNNDIIHMSEDEYNAFHTRRKLWVAELRATRALRT